MLTFKDIQDEVLLLWDQPGETGNFLTIVKNAINDAHAERCQQQRWSFMLWEGVQTFATVDGTLTYQLHPLFGRFHRVYNTTQSKTMVEVPPREYWAAPQDKYHFHIVEPSPVSSQPASTGALTIESSSASDTETAKAVTIKFLDGSNDEQTESLTPTGTTPVSTSASALKVLSVSKGSTWVGTLTVKDSDGNTILTLSATQYGKWYPQIRLLKDPDAADTIEYRFYKKPTVLSNDNDIPDIPYPFSRVLIYDAALLIASYDETREPPAWKEQQLKWNRKLEDNYLEGQAIGAKVRTVRDVTQR